MNIKLHEIAALFTTQRKMCLFIGFQLDGWYFMCFTRIKHSVRMKCMHSLYDFLSLVFS